jgi:hypothetical protein
LCFHSDENCVHTEEKQKFINFIDNLDVKEFCEGALKSRSLIARLIVGKASHGDAGCVSDVRSLQGDKRLYILGVLEKKFLKLRESLGAPCTLEQSNNFEKPVEDPDSTTTGTLLSDDVSGCMKPE